MSRTFENKQNGYSDSIRKGLSAVHDFGYSLCEGTGSRMENIKRLKEELKTADAIVIGAGAGLSAAAGLTYSGERFERYFFDFIERFGIYYNRYIDPAKSAYADLLTLVKDKDYFVITTNVDHQFQRAGFDKDRLFYTQGDYGLFQDAQGRGDRTWDNEAWTMLAMEAQGFVRDENGVFQVPENRKLSMRLTHVLIPTDPKTGRVVAMNLRADDTFAEDAGWHAASARYAVFLKAHEGQHVLFLEMGVGSNTPVIIKYPFWAMTAENPKAVYACLNYYDAVCPKQIDNQSICINGDTGEVLKCLIE